MLEKVQRKGGSFLHCWWESKLVHPLQKIVWRFLLKLKIELLYDPAILLLDIYPEKKKTKTLNLKRYMYPSVIAALCEIAKTQKRPKCTSTDNWFKMWGLPRWLSGKESACQCRRHGFNLCVGKIPWSRKQQPFLVFLPGKFHKQRSLTDCSPQGCKESNTTEHAYSHTWCICV